MMSIIDVMHNSSLYYTDKLAVYMQIIIHYFYDITHTADERSLKVDDVDVYRRLESILAYHHGRQQKTNILLLMVFYKSEVLNKTCTHKTIIR